MYAFPFSGLFWPFSRPAVAATISVSDKNATTTMASDKNATNVDRVAFIATCLTTPENGRRPPRVVRTWFYLFDLYEIDTIKQTFTCLISISYQWMIDNNQIKIISDEDAESSWKLTNFDWDPEIRISNMLEKDNSLHGEDIVLVNPIGVEASIKGRKSTVTKQEWRDLLKTNDSFQAQITHKLRYKATFLHPMQLHEFPFDMQLLRINIYSATSCKNVLMSFRKDIPCAVKTDALPSADWDIHSPRTVAFDLDWENSDPPLLSDSIDSASGARYSCCYIGFTVTRRPLFYMFNVWLMSVLLGSISFTVFTLSPSELGNRLSSLFTLILALVAFKLVVAQSLPAISYLTMLDIFTMVSVGVISSIVIGLSLIAVFGPSTDDDMDSVDRIFFRVTLSLWLAYILFFMAHSFILYRRRQKAVTKIDEKYEQDRKEMASKVGFTQVPLNPKSLDKESVMKMFESIAM